MPHPSPKNRVAPWFPPPASEGGPSGGTVSVVPRSGRARDARHEHLDGLCSPDCAQRHVEAALAESVPHPDPEVERWRQAGQRLGRKIARWVGDDMPPDTALERWFSVPPFRPRFPTEVLHFMEWSALGYRAAPSAPTLAERRLAADRLDDPYLEICARAVLAAQPALVQVEALERGRSLTLRPLLPSGMAVVVPDRGASHTLDVGCVLGARVYRAGVFTFFRPLSVSVPPGREQRVLPVLLRWFTEFVKEGGPDDPAAFLRARPELLFHATADALG